MKKLLAIILISILSWPAPSFAENYTVTGDMGANIRYEVQEQVTAGDGIQKMVLSFVIPQSFQSPTSRQEIKDFSLNFIGILVFVYHNILV